MASYEYYDDDAEDRPELRGFRMSQADESSDHVPDVVKAFVGYLYRSIREKNVYEVHQMYESSFRKLSDRFFSKSLWPAAELIAPYVDNDEVFCMLYKEMYYRHAYAKLSVTLQDRFQSWDNYVNLFTVILHGDVNMQLPNQWLWDMVDEFIYQFQSYCQYRSKLKNKTEQELTMLRQCEEVWNVVSVLSLLQELIVKSNIQQILEDERDGNAVFTMTEGYDYEGGGSNVLKVLGYFSIIGLLHVHCLIGDYYNGLKSIAPIDLTQQGVYSTILGSHVTVAYYYGFANMMLRRYVEAIKTFNQILLYLLKTKQYHQKSPQYDWMLQKTEQMHALLALCLSLCPQQKLLEENVAMQLREKQGDKMAKMQKSGTIEGEAIYGENFSYACPKFITPIPPDYAEVSGNYNEDAYRLQLRMFLSEVRQQQLLNRVRTYVKLYTTISLAKLASFLELDEATLRTAMMTYKHKSHVIEDGSIVSNADVEFYIDEDIVHIADVKPTKQFGDTFIRYIMKFEKLIADLDRIKLE